MEINRSKQAILVMVVAACITAAVAETCSHPLDCNNKCTLGKPLCFAGQCGCSDVASNSAGVGYTNPCYNDGDCRGICTDPKLYGCEQCFAYTCYCHCN